METSLSDGHFGADAWTALQRALAAAIRLRGERPLSSQNRERNPATRALARKAAKFLAHARTRIG